MRNCTVCGNCNVLPDSSCGIATKQGSHHFLHIKYNLGIPIVIAIAYAISLGDKALYMTPIIYISAVSGSTVVLPIMHLVIHVLLHFVNGVVFYAF